MAMTPRDLLREAAYPLTDATLVMAIAGFGLLVWLAIAAGMFGLWLAFIIVPAVFRYAIYLLEARAHGVNANVAGVEIFNIVDNVWGLMPMALTVLAVWAGISLHVTYGQGAALTFLLVVLLLYPASIAVLGITRSPLQSVNPIAIARMIGQLGIDYVWVTLTLASLSWLIFVVVLPLLPGFAAYFLELYLFFLVFTLTGAAVHANEISAEVDIEAPVQKTDEEVADDITAERQTVANHAYGFISRGNREGGFKHIRQHIERETDANAAVIWFFNEMMRWETKDPALFFGQECFSHFLHHGNDAQALKIAAQCVHESPRWRPKAEDREQAIKLAEKYQRDDLLPSLRS